MAGGEATVPPAGCYPSPDPTQPPRYWDGSRWVENGG
jgi:hypothetical protein